MAVILTVAFNLIVIGFLILIIMFGGYGALVVIFFTFNWRVAIS